MINIPIKDGSVPTGSVPSGSVPAAIPMFMPNINRTQPFQIPKSTSISTSGSQSQTD